MANEEGNRRPRLFVEAKMVPKVGYSNGSGPKLSSRLKDRISG